MTAAITGSLASAITQAQPSTAPQTNQSQAAQSQPAASSFGDAVNVSLSAPAQAAVASQNTSASTPVSNTSSSSAPAKQAPVASAPTVDVAQLVADARQKVIPKVGVSGASDVVDKNGNISKVQLAIEIAEQAQKSQKA
ncbi:MAG: hypothetical protein KGI29_08535 [Pseudomonadota bacterium]|nr:hypothetical protein [Pseudomonadota bacterium]MDE3037163.1 hypothetical protein [Pseudomonadota bacterium]